MTIEISAEIRQQLLVAQKNEITEHHIYKKIAASVSESNNRQILEQIAADELSHYNIWKQYTNEEVNPSKLRVWFYTFIRRLFGITFAVKLMEQGEETAQINYAKIAEVLPETQKVHDEEEIHEEKLLSILDEDFLHYAGSVVLGLSDALVELTGALAGLTFAFQNVQLIALSGMITGVAASLSMAASEYLSTSAEKSNKSPVRSALYTGITYILTVTALILPYLFLKNEYVCLAIALATAVLIIAAFNYYIAVAQGENFRRRFFEMAGLSLAVAAISFVIGFFIRTWWGIDI